MSSMPPRTLCRLGRKALPLMSSADRAEALALIAEIEGRTANAEEHEQVAAAFEADMRPVVVAIVDALREGDTAALRGLRAMLPGLLGTVLGNGALEEEMCRMIGREVAEGIVEKSGERNAEGGEDLEGLSSGNGRVPFDKVLHPRGAIGRFVNSQIKRGRKAMQRVIREETDVLSAMEREDVGEIDFLWDHNGMGVRHIIARRMEQDEKRPDLNTMDAYELLDRIPEVIMRGEVANPEVTAGTVVIEHGGIRVLLARRKGRTGNVWLMSGFEIDPESQRGRRNR